MSPVGGQGVNIALRDALVAANHLCPVLCADGNPSAIDAAERGVQDERWPEIVVVQHMQEEQVVLSNPQTPAVNPRNCEGGDYEKVVSAIQAAETKRGNAGMMR